MSSYNDALMVISLFPSRDSVVTFKDADQAGVPRGAIRRSWQREVVHRVGKSSFVLQSAWDAADRWARFRFQALGFAGSVDGAFLTGEGAAMLHHIPVTGAPPDVPVMLRPGDPHLGSIRSAHGRTRHGHLPLVHQVERHGFPVVSAPYTLVDIARHGTPLAGLMAADHVLHSGVHRDTVAAIGHRMLAYPGMDRVSWALTHADDRCESPLETLGRYAFIRAGRRPPQSNVWIYGPGKPRRADHLIVEHGIVIEGDGAVKYDNRPDAARVVDDEKDRQRWMQRLGFSVVRYNHAMASNRPEEILWEVDRAIADRRGRPAPTCWSLEPPWARTA